jgi:hydroxymethylpyrimidine pyrophosphatase-like HAD family hydrolase
MIRGPLPRVAACDVDGTLICGGRVNVSLVARLSDLKRKGWQILVWSARGTAYAKRAVKIANMEKLEPVVIGKPGLFADDKGWAWTRDSRPLLPVRGRKRNG